MKKGNKVGQFTKEVAKTKKVARESGIKFGFFFGAWVVFSASILVWATSL